MMEKIVEGKLYVSNDGGKTWTLKEGEATTPATETPAVETPEKKEPVEPGADGDVEKLAADIANKAVEIATTKAVEVVNSRMRSNDNQPQLVSGKKMKLYTTRKGKDVEIDKSAANLLGSWLKSVMYRDHAGAQKAYAEMVNTKLEPLNEGTAAEGGFLVPTLLHNTLIDIVQDASVMAQIATTIDMSGMKTDTLEVDAVATRPLAQWGSENTDKSTSSMTFGQQTLTPYLLASIVPFTKQLRDDSPFNIVQILTAKMAESIAVAEDHAFFTGSGTGRPTGLNTYTFRGRDWGDVAPTYDMINDMYFTLPPAYRAKAVWVANSELIKALSNIKDSNGFPIFRESITQPGMMDFKGRPVYEQNDLEATSLFFGDFSYYWIARKGGIEIDLADQATVGGVSLWQRNLLALRAETRVDGECVLTRAFVETSNINIG